MNDPGRGVYRSAAPIKKTTEFPTLVIESCRYGLRYEMEKYCKNFVSQGQTIEHFTTYHPDTLALEMKKFYKNEINAKVSKTSRTKYKVHYRVDVPQRDSAKEEEKMDICVRLLEFNQENKIICVEFTLIKGNTDDFHKHFDLIRKEVLVPNICIDFDSDDDY